LISNIKKLHSGNLDSQVNNTIPWRSNYRTRKEKLPIIWTISTYPHSARVISWSIGL